MVQPKENSGNLRDKEEEQPRARRCRWDGWFTGEAVWTMKKGAGQTSPAQGRREMKCEIRPTWTLSRLLKGKRDRRRARWRELRWRGDQRCDDPRRSKRDGQEEGDDDDDGALARRRGTWRRGDGSMKLNGGSSQWVGCFPPTQYLTAVSLDGARSLNASLPGNPPLPTPRKGLLLVLWRISSCIPGS
jgi:hypothetical protein